MFAKRQNLADYEHLPAKQQGAVSGRPNNSTVITKNFVSIWADSLLGNSAELLPILRNSDGKTSRVPSTAETLEMDRAPVTL